MCERAISFVDDIAAGILNGEFAIASTWMETKPSISQSSIRRNLTTKLRFALEAKVSRQRISQNQGVIRRSGQVKQMAFAG